MADTRVAELTHAAVGIAYTHGRADLGAILGAVGTNALTRGEVAATASGKTDEAEKYEEELGWMRTACGHHFCFS